MSGTLLHRLDGTLGPWYPISVACLRPLVLALTLLALSQPAHGQDQPAAAPPTPRPLEVPAPLVVPEPVVEPPRRQLEPLPAPQRIRRQRLEFVVGGAGLTTSVWAAERLLAQELTTTWTHWLPLLGPWFLLAYQRQQASPSDAVSAFLVLDGLAQAAGATLVALGLVLRKERLVIRLPPVQAQPGLGLGRTLHDGLAVNRP
ncbi:MAG: hypothetical protein RMK29_04715 [Myxococcales bacterium]|nr:hypothetical protein [Myxococcota bacterium]MDW8280992.1 hypothetical protein [Myxococcales bacterium]